jgi:hypothetical protein
MVTTEYLNSRRPNSYPHLFFPPTRKWSALLKCHESTPTPSVAFLPFTLPTMMLPIGRNLRIGTLAVRFIDKRLKHFEILSVTATSLF